MTVEITRDGTHMEGSLRLFEPGVGELRSRLFGEWTNDNNLSATLEQFTGISAGAVTLPQTARLEGTFDAKENVISGRWRTDIDTAGEFRWIQAASPQPNPADILAAVPARFVRYWGRFVAGIKILLGKPKIKWNKRYTKWLLVGLQLSLAGLVGYLAIDFLIGN
jgi:hypothetical protein